MWYLSEKSFLFLLLNVKLEAELEAMGSFFVLVTIRVKKRHCHV